MNAARVVTSAALLLVVAAGTVAAVTSGYRPSPKEPAPNAPGGAAKAPETPKAPEAAAIPESVGRGIDYLAKAQNEDGGWGAGWHAKQDVRDPHAVPSDPATTSFVAMALIRAGHTPSAGEHRERVARAVDFVAKSVLESDDEGPRVTSLTGTQPQTKMGPLVDTPLAVQFLSRVVPLLPSDGERRVRADHALDKALGKLSKAQGADGRWGSGGWANVLQSSLGGTALEMAQAAGKPVSDASLASSRKALQENVDAKSGEVEASEAAGVPLYALAGAGRSSAKQQRDAEDALEAAKAAGALPADADLSRENLRKAGLREPQAEAAVAAIGVGRAVTMRLEDDQVLKGFGNNGGEEFLSYMMTSESLVIRGGEDWTKWRTKLLALLEKVQSSDGSWTGHHCITSPVFCTAAVVGSITADRDAAFLLARSEKDAKK
jgi:hypothetical protein